MDDKSDEERHSVALAPDLITDPNSKAEREAANALRQFDYARSVIDAGLQPDTPFRLRPSLILSLHRDVLQGISPYAGTWRPGPVEIGKSKHVPPAAHLVPELIEDMCDYVMGRWAEKSPVELSAYVLWRLNWIHPFTDGNGRTARAASYIVLCSKAGTQLPGINTIPEQISAKKAPYYKALEAADAAATGRKIDVSELATYLADLLSNQLVSIHGIATRDVS